MRQHNCCTKCGHKRLWVVDRVLYSLDMYGFEAKALSVAKLAGHHTGGAPEMIGKFQAIICAHPGCGYTEWHAHELDSLKELAKDPSSGVRFIDNDPGGRGPFR